MRIDSVDFLESALCRCENSLTEDMYRCDRSLHAQSPWMQYSAFVLFKLPCCSHILLRTYKSNSCRSAWSSPYEYRITTSGVVRVWNLTARFFFCPLYAEYCRALTLVVYSSAWLHAKTFISPLWHAPIFHELEKALPQYFGEIGPLFTQRTVTILATVCMLFVRCAPRGVSIFSKSSLPRWNFIIHSASVIFCDEDLQMGLLNFLNRWNS